MLLSCRFYRDGVRSRTQGRGSGETTKMHPAGGKTRPSRSGGLSFCFVCFVCALVCGGMLGALGCSSDPVPADTGQAATATCPAPGTPVDPASEVSMVFDLTGAPITGGADFFDLPFPLDLRLDVEGKADLSNFPNPDDNAEVRQIVGAAHRYMDGWPTATQIYLRLTGPVDPASLPADPAAYRSSQAVVQLLDVDPASPERGRRFPLEVGFNAERETFRPANLLQVLPVQGFELRENNTYAVIVTRDLSAAAGRDMVADPNLCSVLAGRMPAGALGPEALDAYAPLAAQLALEGRDPGTVAAATVFTTGNPTERMFPRGGARGLVARARAGSPPHPHRGVRRVLRLHRLLGGARPAGGQRAVPGGDLRRGDRVRRSR